MPKTVFYSWQSDLPNPTNRTFIENCLTAAIAKLNDTHLQSAEREDDNITLDSDTKGEPGQAHISETIMEKIDRCSAFAFDLSFIAMRKDGTGIPNPNVLIEYGYARRACGLGRMVPIINAYYGLKKPTDLPFDLRHLSGSIVYSLAPDATPEEKAEVKKQLIKDLHAHISLIFSKNHDDAAIDDGFAAQEPTFSSAAFFGKEEEFPKFHDSGQIRAHAIVPKVPLVFLRLVPKRQLELSGTEIVKKINSSDLRPMGDRPRSWGFHRNARGAAVISTEDDTCIRYLTQVFKSGELWGIDAEMLDFNLRAQQYNKGHYVPCVVFEECFVRALENYRVFIREILGLEPPYLIIAGATEIKNFQLATHYRGGNGLRGHIFENEIVWDHIDIDAARSARETLIPFFETVWDRFGEVRPNVEVLP